MGRKKPEGAISVGMVIDFRDTVSEFISTLKEELRKIDGETIGVSLDEDVKNEISSLRKELNDLSADYKSTTNNLANSKVDNKAFVALYHRVEDVVQRVEKLENGFKGLGNKIDTSGLDSCLDHIKAELSSVNAEVQKIENKDPVVNVTANVTSAQKSLKKLADEADALDEKFDQLSKGLPSKFKNFKNLDFEDQIKEIEALFKEFDALNAATVSKNPQERIITSAKMDSILLTIERLRPLVKNLNGDLSSVSGWYEDFEEDVKIANDNIVSNRENLDKIITAGENASETVSKAVSKTVNSTKEVSEKAANDAVKAQEKIATAAEKTVQKATQATQSGSSSKSGKIGIPVDFEETAANLKAKLKVMLEDLQNLATDNAVKIPVVLYSDEAAKTQKSAFAKIMSAFKKTSKEEEGLIGTSLTEGNVKFVTELAKSAYLYAKAEFDELRRYTEDHKLNIKVHVSDETKEQLQAQLEEVAGKATLSFGDTVKKLYSTKSISSWGKAYLDKLDEFKRKVEEIAPTIKEGLYPTSSLEPTKTKVPNDVIDNSNFAGAETAVGGLTSKLNTLAGVAKNFPETAAKLSINSDVINTYYDLGKEIDAVVGDIDELSSRIPEIDRFKGVHAKISQGSIGEFNAKVSGIDQAAQDVLSGPGLTGLSNYRISKESFDSIDKFIAKIKEIGTAIGAMFSATGNLYRLQYFKVYATTYEDIDKFIAKLQEINTAAKDVLSNKDGLSGIRYFEIPENESITKFKDSLNSITTTAQKVLIDESGLGGLKAFTLNSDGNTNIASGLISAINDINNRAGEILLDQNGLGGLTHITANAEAIRAFNSAYIGLLDNLDENARASLSAQDGIGGILNLTVNQEAIHNFAQSIGNLLTAINLSANKIINDPNGFGGIVNVTITKDAAARMALFPVLLLKPLNDGANKILNDQNGLGGIRNFTISQEAIEKLAVKFGTMFDAINQAANMILNDPNGLGGIRDFNITEDAARRFVLIPTLMLGPLNRVASEILKDENGLGGIRNFTITQTTIDNIEAFKRKLDEINAKATSIIGDQSGLGALRSFALDAGFSGSVDTVQTHLNGLGDAIDAIGRKKEILEYLKTYAISQNGIDTINSFKNGFNAINRALNSFDKNVEFLSDIERFADALIRLGIILEAFKRSFPTDTTFAFQFPQDVITQIDAFRTALENAAEVIRIFPGNDAFARNVRSISRALATILENLPKLANKRPKEAIGLLNSIKIQKSAGKYLDDFRKSLKSLMDYITKDMPQDNIGFLDKISNMLGKKEELRDLATILKATATQIRSMEDILAGEKQKVNEKTSENSYKNILRILKEIRKLEDDVVNGKGDTTANKNKISFLKQELDAEKKILESTGIRNAVHDSEMRSIVYDINDLETKIARLDEIEERYRELNGLLQNRLDIEIKIQQLASKLFDTEVSEDEKVEARTGIQELREKADAYDKLIDKEHELIQAEGQADKKFEDNYNKVMNQISRLQFKNANKVDADSVIAKDSQEWANAVEILKKYKEQLGEIQSIVRRMRRDPADPTNYFVSYLAKGTKGSVDVGLNGKLLIEKDNVALVKQEYQNLEKAIKDYGTAAKQVVARIDLATNQAKLAAASKAIEDSKKVLEDYVRQGWTTDEQVNAVLEKRSTIDADLITRLEGLRTKYDELSSTLNSAQGKTTQYAEKLKSFNGLFDEYKSITSKDIALFTAEDFKKLSDIEAKIKDLKKELTSNKYDLFNTKRGTLTNFVNSKEIERATAEMEGVISASVKIQHQGQNVVVQYEKMNGEAIRQKYIWDENAKAFGTFGSEVIRGSSNFFQRFNTDIKQSIDRFKNYFSGYMLIRQVVNVARQGIDVIKEIDKQFVEMRKVSNETAQSLRQYVDLSFDVAKAIGSTSTSILSSTADYMRLGKSLEQAAELAKATTILMNVSEFDNIQEATESMISLTQAYQELDSMDIIDKLNNIGNNFSISTSDLAQSLQKSAGTLRVAGNDLNEAIALTTAGNAILQDPAKVAAGIRTISLRITGTTSAKKELEELGEEVDDFVVTTSSKLNEKVIGLTKTATHQAGVSLLNAQGNYRSTYEILQDIADVWKEIAEEDTKTGQNRQNALLELLAGKNRSNVLASILSDGKLLRDVFEAVQNSSGSAMVEQMKYMDSIEGKLNVLQTSVQSLWNTIIDSDTVKNVVEFLTTIVDGTDYIIKNVGTLTTVLTALGGALGAKNFGLIQTDGNGRFTTIFHEIATLFRTGKSTEIRDLATQFNQLSESTKANITQAKGWENWGKSVGLAGNQTTVLLRNLDSGKTALADFSTEMTNSGKVVSKVASTMMSTFANLAIGALIGIGISLIQKAIDDWYTTIEEQQAKINQINADIKETSDQISVLEDKQKAGGKLTEAEKARLSYLKNQTAEYKRQLEEQKKIADQIKVGNHLLSVFDAKTYANRATNLLNKFNNAAGISGVDYFLNPYGIPSETKIDSAEFYKNILKNSPDFLSDTYVDYWGLKNIIESGTLDSETLEQAKRYLKIYENVISKFYEAQHEYAMDWSTSFMKDKDMEDPVSFLTKFTQDAFKAYTTITSKEDQNISEFYNNFPGLLNGLMTHGIDVLEVLDGIGGWEFNQSNAIEKTSSRFAELSIDVAGTAEALEKLNEVLDESSDKISSLKDAQDKLKSGELSDSDVYDLLNKFPEIANSIDWDSITFGNLSEAISEGIEKEESVIKETLENRKEELLELLNPSNITEEMRSAYSKYSGFRDKALSLGGDLNAKYLKDKFGQYYVEGQNGAKSFVINDHIEMADAVYNAQEAYKEFVAAVNGTDEEVAQVMSYLSGATNEYSAELDVVLAKLAYFNSNSHKTLANYRDEYDSVLGSVNSLDGAIEKLLSKEMTDTEVIELMRQFKELATFDDIDLNDKVNFGNLLQHLMELRNGLPMPLIKELQDLRDAIAATASPETLNELDTLIVGLQRAVTFDETGLDAFTQAITDAFGRTDSTVQSTLSYYEDLATLQEAVADGFVLDAEKAWELAQMFPELTKGIMEYGVAGDGLVELNEEIVKGLLEGGDTAIDATVKQLQAEKELLIAKKNAAETELQIAIDALNSKDRAQKEAAIVEVERYLEVGKQKLKIEQEVDEGVAQSDQDQIDNHGLVARMVGKVSKFFSENMGQAAQDASQSVSDSSEKMQWSLANIVDAAQGAWAAVKSIGQNVFGGFKSVVGGAGGSTIFNRVKGWFGNFTSGVAAGVESLQTKVTNFVDTAWDTSFGVNSRLEELIADLHIELGNYDDAIAAIDGQITTLLNLQGNVAERIKRTADDAGSGSGSDGSDAAEKEFSETFDWIERAIEVLEKAINRLSTAAGNVYTVFSKRNRALLSEMDKVREEIGLQQAAYETYLAIAESIDLSEEYKTKVQQGLLQVEIIENEELAEKINLYKEWYFSCPYAQKCA